MHGTHCPILVMLVMLWKGILITDPTTGEHHDGVDNFVGVSSSGLYFLNYFLFGIA